VSKYEEQAYRVGGGKPNPNAKPNVPLLKSQLARLRHDLEQFIARKPDGSVIAPLKERIREMEATIASAEAENKRERQSARNSDDDDDTGARQELRSTSSRFPPRGRPGRSGI
jgi:uncharacterized protein involved in exopolysaccharide biosynthesis